MAKAGVLEALRRDTRAEHDRIELLLDWRSRASDRDSYRAWLERLYGFHRVWEPAVAAALGDPTFTDPRRRLTLIADDLARMGRSPGALAALPSPEFARGYGGAAEALGSLYVIEGSTLGGQLIARHVAATLGITPAYHGGYGRATGAMWRGFQQKLETVAAADEGRVVASAVATFRDLGAWLSQTGNDRP